MEVKPIDQEAEHREDDLGIHAIPEDKDDNDMDGFLNNLLKTSLDFPV